MNLPNKLSIARMALIPVMVALMYPNNLVCNLLAAAVFGAAAFTDYLDPSKAKNGRWNDYNLKGMLTYERDRKLPFYALQKAYEE